LPDTTSKHVGTATELNCLLPIRPGFIPVLDTRTYATRLRVVFKVLQGLRVTSRELCALRPILDIVDAARTVHAFSWSIVAERQLLLSVAFDRPWEPYIRVIWKDLGPLLDLILCNCEGYVPSTEPFELYAEYVRQHQLEAGFFYPSSSLTVNDQAYLVQLEKVHRDGTVGFDSKAVTLVAPGAAELAKTARHHDPGEADKQWLIALDALYGLRSLYPEDSADHVYLARAATTLLGGSRPQAKLPESPELDWFNRSAAESRTAAFERRKIERHNVQGGILKPYPKVTHGCLLLARVEDAAAARGFIGQMAGRITRDDGHPDDGVYMNVAFTFSGLEQLGVKESDLARFPKEFREGMDARAGLLGDVRENHPENWTLPEWNVRFKENGHSGTTTVEFTGRPAEGAGKPAADDSGARRQTPPVRMSTVDIVITVYKAKEWTGRHGWTPEHPLHSRVVEFCTDARKRGIQVLSVQPMRRLRPEQAGRKPVAHDHFGFVDGIGQPNAVDDPREFNEVEMGELFVGFQNQRRDPPFPEHSTDPAAWIRGSLIDCGSFLVVRKLRQHVGALHAVLDRATGEGIDRDLLLAKMVGRTTHGVPLVDSHGPGTPPTDFDFSGDPNGKDCPFHAHIRRANPRLPASSSDAPQPTVPRFVRRAMAYGPPFERNDDADRGMMFMAYNASIAEQFEIIQRWMSGGNTPADQGGSGVFSGQPDPLLGLPDTDGKRTYRFLHDGGVHSVNLGPEPFVTLQWGLYLFAPSISALELLAKDPEPDLATAQTVIAFGSSVIQNLATLDDWTAVLEDVSANLSGATAAVFAAIRANHGGAIRTPYGVIVASSELAMQVLRTDPDFSVVEYQRRFGFSVGKGYLGMDRGPEYQAASGGPNRTLDEVTEKQACAEAYTLTKNQLRRTIQFIAKMADPPGAVKREPDGLVTVPLEPVVDQVVAQLAQQWFDIPDGDLIKVGGRPSNGAETLHCPFSFLAPSRFVFSAPNPRDKVTELGESQGKKLLEKVREFVDRRRKDERAGGTLGLHGPISKALFRAIPGDDDLLSRTLLGLVFGFVPTVYGNALQVLGLWLGDETLWRVQQRLLSATDDGIHERASSVLQSDLELAMQTRPVPPLLHRTVTVARKLGGVDLTPGDRVVLGMSGATGETLARGGSDPMLIFGGDRLKDDKHPTHACPGYAIAMGVLLGLLAAILEAGTLTPTPALVTIRVPRPNPMQ
jgi:Dyp-type peroxidase family